MSDSKRRKRWLLPLLILLSGWAAAVPGAGREAWADDAAATNSSSDPFEKLDRKTRSKVIKLADQAQTHYEHGEYEKAAELFTQAEAIVPIPTVEIALAKTLIKLSRLADAAAMYEKAIAAKLTAETPAPLIEAVARAKDDLHELLPRVPALEISLGTGVCCVEIDGRKISEKELSAPIRLNPGPHSVASSGAPTQRIALKEGERRRLQLSLPPQRPMDWKFVTGVVGLSVSVLALGTGVGSTVRFVQLKDNFEPYRSITPYAQQPDICAFARSTQNDPKLTVDSTKITELCNGISVFSTMQFIMYPLHLASAAAGIYFLLTSPYMKQRKSAAFQLIPHADLKSAGVNLRVHF